MTTTEQQAVEAVYLCVTSTPPCPAIRLGNEGGVPDRTAAWIRVVVQWRQPLPMSHGPTGGRHVTRRGAVLAQCFYPWSVENGVKGSLDLATALRTLFEGVSLATVGGGSLEMETGEVRVIGTDKTWHQTNVEVPFTFDATI